MHIGRFVGAAAIVPLALVGCGSSGNDNAKAQPPSASASASPSVSPQVQQELTAAYGQLDDATNVSYGTTVVAINAKKLSEIQSGARMERQAFTEYDAALRRIDFPASAQQQRNAVLTDVGAIITALDAVNDAQTAKEATDAYYASFDHTDRDRADRDALFKSVGNPPQTPPVKLRTLYVHEKFSAATGWGTPIDERRVVTGGDSYNVTEQGGLAVRLAPTPGTSMPQDVAVEATFTMPTHPKSQFGLSCPGSNGDAYEGLVSPNGATYLGYAFGGSVKSWLATTDPGTAKLDPTTNVLRLDCRKSKTGTVVRLYVNGKVADSAGWTEPTALGHHPGMAFNVFEKDRVSMSHWKVSEIL